MDAIAAEQAIERKQALNRLAAGYYVAGIVGLIVVSCLLSNARRLPHSYAPKAASQALRRLMMGIGFGTILIMPHYILVAAAFLGLNLGLLAWKMNWTDLAFIGSRFGWLALCNMCLAIFLAMKNIPLSPLGGKTYRDLNALHRLCGYVTVIEVVLHASLFSSGLYRIHEDSELRTSIVYAGAVAGSAMMAIALTANYYFRRRFYNTFFLLHVFLVIIILICVGLHKSDIREKALIIVIVSAFLWTLDRTIRYARWLYYGHHGYCTLTPLPHGATKVTMTRSIQARAGSHVLLWIPSIGLLEQHPFSLLGEEPVEFVVAARRGFTRRLYDTACKTPGVRLRAMMDGPYGRAPSVKNFDRVLLISGGSGVTFAMSLAMAWLRTANEGDFRSLQFVWIVKSKEQLRWFTSELQQLKAHPGVTVTIHVTDPANALTDDPTSPQSPALSDDSSAGPRSWSQDLEKNVTSDKELYSVAANDASQQESRSNIMHSLNRGRPIIDMLFKQAMAGVSKDDKTLVTGSGPAQLLSDIQDATGAATRIGGPEMHLHLEPYET